MQDLHSFADSLLKTAQAPLDAFNNFVNTAFHAPIDSAFDKMFAQNIMKSSITDETSREIVKEIASESTKQVSYGAFWIAGTWLVDSPLFANTSPGAKKIIVTLFATPSLAQTIFGVYEAFYKDGATPSEEVADILMDTLSTAVGVLGITLDNKEMQQAAAILIVLFGIVGAIEEGIENQNKSELDKISGLLPTSVIAKLTGEIADSATTLQQELQSVIESGDISQLIEKFKLPENLNLAEILKKQENEPSKIRALAEAIGLGSLIDELSNYHVIDVEEGLEHANEAIEHVLALPGTVVSHDGSVINVSTQGNIITYLHELIDSSFLNGERRNQVILSGGKNIPAGTVIPEGMVAQLKPSEEQSLRTILENQASFDEISSSGQTILNAINKPYAVLLVSAVLAWGAYSFYHDRNKHDRRIKKMQAKYDDILSALDGQQSELAKGKWQNIVAEQNGNGLGEEDPIAKTDKLVQNIMTDNFGGDNGENNAGSRTANSRTADYSYEQYDEEGATQQDAENLAKKLEHYKQVHGWWHSFEQSSFNAANLAILAAPCAIVAATMVVPFIRIGQATKGNLLSSDLMTDWMADIEHLVMDLRGPVMKHSEVGEHITDGFEGINDAWPLLAALQGHFAEHPIGQTVLTHLETLGLKITELAEGAEFIAGDNYVTGKLGEQTLYSAGIGGINALKDKIGEIPEKISAQITNFSEPIFLAVKEEGGQATKWLAFDNKTELVPGAAETILELIKRNIKVTFLTGSSEDVALDAMEKLELAIKDLDTEGKHFAQFKKFVGEISNVSGFVKLEDIASKVLERIKANLSQEAIETIKKNGVDAKVHAIYQMAEKNNINLPKTAFLLDAANDLAAATYMRLENRIVLAVQDMNTQISGTIKGIGELIHVAEVGKWAERAMLANTGVAVSYVTALVGNYFYGQYKEKSKKHDHPDKIKLREEYDAHQQAHIDALDNHEHKNGAGGAVNGNAQEAPASLKPIDKIKSHEIGWSAFAHEFPTIIALLAAAGEAIFINNNMGKVATTSR